MKTNQKLWIFGDSFAMLRHGELSWQILLKNKFIGDDVIVSGRGGRDIQSIIDIFLKSLHLIKDDDLVIMILPTASRIRYPIKEPELNLLLNDGTITNELESCISDCFTAYHPNSIFHKNIKSKLILPLDIIDDTMIEDVDENDEDKSRERHYNIFETKELINKKQKLSHTQIATFINTSESALKNYNEQFNSFSKAFKFKMMILSWCSEFDIFDETIIISDYKLQKQLGKLQSEHDLYMETNGKFGNYGDFHWSESSDKKISEFIINNNPNYFVK